MNKSVFSPYPTMQTDRLLLRQLHQDDASAIFTLRSSAEANKYINRPLAGKLQDAHDFIERMLQANQQQQSFLWALERPGIPFVGSVLLWNLNEEQNSAEIGYELLPAYQGRGFAREAVDAVLEFAFDSLGVAEVHAWIHPGNAASLKLVQQLDFVFKGIAEKEIGYHIYVISRADH